MLHRLPVPEDAQGTRLDVWLEAQLPGCSRSLVARCIREERCQISSGKAKPGFRLRGGELIEIEVPELEVHDIEPEDIPLEVLYEDDDLLLVNKPPGMVVHPAIGHPRGTLLAAVLGRYGQPGTDCQGAALIHRLDADTSGIIAIARHSAALAYFQGQFRQRAVGKQYLALLAGQAGADWWSCHQAIGRHPRDFRKRAVVAADSKGARSAHSDFLVRARLEHGMAVEVRLHTGRTHQIRVHAAHAGHPVLADGVYGRHDRWPLQGQAQLTRQGLHAWRLHLRLMNGEALAMVAPIPDDLAGLLPNPLQPSPLELPAGISDIGDDGGD
ncbi:MAG: RluA family pseudouridine synthase [Planctomycetota bacterium]|nr:MAG: RluA family pseudouridine synthase [Planctomycetota bacterium]